MDGGNYLKIYSDSDSLSYHRKNYKNNNKGNNINDDDDDDEDSVMSSSSNKENKDLMVYKPLKRIKKNKMETINES